ncbi:MAG: bifunctional DNA primase/polymerase [Actinomycetia bacterium]|nr:bifunctional DNA primase/polymerase [Actinomycetes bacterium]
MDTSNGARTRRVTETDTAASDESTALSNLEAALEYAERDWPVYPLHTIQDGSCSCGKTVCTSPGKHPQTARGFKDASADAGQVRLWWTTWPNANVGVRTGSDAGLVVLDIDAKNSGMEALARLEAEHGDLPATLKARTGGSGSHIYFHHPGGEIPNSARFGGGYELIPSRASRSQAGNAAARCVRSLQARSSVCEATCDNEVAYETLS